MKSEVDVEELVKSMLAYVRGMPVEGMSSEQVHDVLGYDASKLKVVVLGGGTGLSTVIGGNSKLSSWVMHPFGGLKAFFPDLDIIVCSTDDGGSTGELLKTLPMIAIGDLRKCSLSMISEQLLCHQYGLTSMESARLIECIQGIYNYRFSKKSRSRKDICIPLRWRRCCPPALLQIFEWALNGLCDANGCKIDPAGHCLGNLILAGAVFRESGTFSKPAGLRALQRALDHMAMAIGAPSGRIHPATCVPGQLTFRYSNGVEVVGQSKSAWSRRGFPVEQLGARFVAEPLVSKTVIRKLNDADLIIYAPGSLYSSILPVLQLTEVTAAIRANRKAIKILGANFWAQAGETDISMHNAKRSFWVSDLVDAYAQNVSGGMAGLFDVVLCADLSQIKGSIFRNYALENKTPIHLDRRCVAKTGLRPVEVNLFAVDTAIDVGTIKHDADQFAWAVKSLAFVQKELNVELRGGGDSESVSPTCGTEVSKGLLCEYYDEVARMLSMKKIRRTTVRTVLHELTWRNRDISLKHLVCFSGVEVLKASQWTRSNEWDNILGYYDDVDNMIKLHEDVLADRMRLESNLLIALGESLLGNYLLRKTWRCLNETGRCYEIELRRPAERKGFLTESQMVGYLKLARMQRVPGKTGVFQLVLNDDEGFLPSGLLFGMMYAWYLDNRYSPTIEYEMSLLRRHPGALIPHQAKECVRRQALVSFFRTEVFSYCE